MPHPRHGPRRRVVRNQRSAVPARRQSHYYVSDVWENAGLTYRDYGDDIISPRAERVRRTLSMIEDRRRWAPGTTLKKLSGKPFHTLIVPDKKKRDGRPTVLVVPHWSKYAPKRELRHTLDDVLSGRVGFFQPENMVICVRRQRRRRAIFAFNHAGKGKKRTRNPRRNEWSEVRC